MVASGRDFFDSIGKALLIQRPSPVPLPAFADKKKNQKIRLTACPSTIGAEPMNSLWITFHNPLEELRKIGQVKLLRRRAGCFRNRPRGPLVGKGICIAHRANGYRRDSAHKRRLSAMRAAGKRKTRREAPGLPVDA
jgi:hypothetical protein